MMEGMSFKFLEWKQNTNLLTEILLEGPAR